jgi:hypothetical protein
MVNKISKDGRPTPGTVEHQIRSMLHQPEPPSGASGELPWPTREEDILEGNDLLTHDTGEDFTPPPAYGDTYGEIRNEKDGASARVTDDGRVNIRINQVNRRLSQIFTPALRQQTQNVQDNGPPPPPYIPPSLGGKEGELPPPPKKDVIQVASAWRLIPHSKILFLETAWNSSALVATPLI